METLRTCLGKFPIDVSIVFIYEQIKSDKNWKNYIMCRTLIVQHYQDMLMMAVCSFLIIF